VKKINARTVVFIVLGAVLVAAAGYVVWDSIANSKPAPTKSGKMVPVLTGPSGIVAKVGNIEISLKEYTDLMAKERLSYITTQGRDIDDPVNSQLLRSIRDNVLDGLIESAVYKNYAAENKLLPTDADVAKAVNEDIDAQATESGGYDKFEKKLRDGGIESVDALRKKMISDNAFRDQMTQSAVKAHLQKKVSITEQEARDFYEARLIGISKIVLWYDEKLGDEQLTKEGYETLNRIRDLIGTKGTFEDIAINFSQDSETAKNGGKVQDLFIKGALPPEIDKEIWNLKVGEVSKPILTKDSFWLVRIDFETYVWQYYFADTKNKTKTPFEKIKNKVADQLITIKVLEEENKWFSKYRDSLKIDVYLDYKEIPAETPEKTGK
jgi:parvulin-like peptidyl-prolyl isomerase